LERTLAILKIPKTGAEESKPAETKAATMTIDVEEALRRPEGDMWKEPYDETASISQFVLKRGKTFFPEMEDLFSRKPMTIREVHKILKNLSVFMNPLVAAKGIGTHENELRGYTTARLEHLRKAIILTMQYSSFHTPVEEEKDIQWAALFLERLQLELGTFQTA
jgi:hypothetical protein